MGYPTPEPEPQWGLCTACCDELVSFLFMDLKHVDLPIFTGELNQHEEYPCEFSGTLWNEDDDHTAVYLYFCDDFDDVRLDVVSPLLYPCTGFEFEDWNCWPWFHKKTTYCEYWIWP